MKKVSLKIAFILLLMISITSFIGKDIVVQTFSQEILGKKISGYFLDQMINELPIEESSKIEQNIRNHKETKKITSKFIQTIIDNRINQKETKFEIEEEIDWLIAENVTKLIEPQKLKEIRSYVIEQVTNIEKRLEENLLESMGEHYEIILKIYNIFTNIYFKSITILLELIIGISLLVLEKYRVWKTLKNCSFVLTIWLLGIFILIKLMEHFIDQNLAGGWLIHLDALIGWIIIGMILSILLMLIEKKINLKIYSKE